MRRRRYQWLNIMTLAVVTVTTLIGHDAQSETLRLGISKAPSSGLFFIARDQGYFRNSGLDVEFVEYVSGKRALIDAFSMREPFVSQAKRRMGENTIVFAAPGIYQQSDLLVASRDLVTNRSGALASLLRALVRARDFAKETPSVAKEIVARALGVELSAIEGVWAENRMEVYLDQALLLRLEDQARWALRGNLVQGQAIPNYLEFLQPEVLTAVEPAAVHLISIGGEEWKVVSA